MVNLSLYHAIICCHPPVSTPPPPPAVTTTHHTVLGHDLPSHRPPPRPGESFLLLPRRAGRPGGPRQAEPGRGWWCIRGRPMTHDRTQAGSGIEGCRVIYHVMLLSCHVRSGHAIVRSGHMTHVKCRVLFLSYNHIQSYPYPATVSCRFYDYILDIFDHDCSPHHGWLCSVTMTS